MKENGGPIAYDFKFKNTGDQPIVIQNVQASCGCTTPDWTKTPVAPGASGFIKAQYNPLGRPGQFNKSLTITSNATEGSTVVFIKGNVIPDVAPAAPAEGATPTVTPSAPAPVVAPAPENKSAAPKTAPKKGAPAKKKAPAKKPAAKKTTTSSAK